MIPVRIRTLKDVSVAVLSVDIRNAFRSLGHLRNHPKQNAVLHVCQIPAYPRNKNKYCVLARTYIHVYYIGTSFVNTSENRVRFRSIFFLIIIIISIIHKYIYKYIGSFFNPFFLFLLLEQQSPQG